jgi:N-acetylneuraminic acid mutarotase
MIREIRAIRRYLFAGLGLVVVLGVSSLPSRSLIPPERATHADLAYARQLVTRLRWVNRASMPTARSWASAVEYGGKIYVVGGCSSTQPQQFENPVANLEMYDPETDTWTRLSPMSLARVGPAVAVLNGKIYVMGGFDPMQYWSANPTVEIYDIKTGRWSRGPSMPTGVSWASAVVLDGKIYVLGGVGFHYYDIMQIFDPSTNRWSYGPSFKGGRYLHAAVAYGGKIYLIGGDSWETGSDVIYNDIQVYDPVSNSWSAKRPMPTAATGLSAVAWEGKIYLFAGNGFARVYHIACDSWEEVTFPNQDPSGEFSTCVYNGVIYRFGGGGWGPTTRIVQSLILCNYGG